MWYTVGVVGKDDERAKVVSEVPNDKQGETTMNTNMKSKITNAFYRNEYVKVMVKGDHNMYVTTIDEIEGFVHNHKKVLNAATVIFGDIREMVSLRNIVIDHYYEGLEYHFVKAA